MFFGKVNNNNAQQQSTHAQQLCTTILNCEHGVIDRAHARSILHK